MKFTVLLAFLFLLLFCSCGKKQGFKRLSAKQSGIDFNNLITENDSINILDLEYVYNGGGVAIADFNNDGLQDVFFTGNMVSNRLYMNDGKLHFRDVTKQSSIDQKNRWCTGAVTVDINNDGLMDIYACASIKNNPADRANLLYINKGVGKDGNPVFEEQGIAYNVADTGHTTNAAFFDYDNDGDLDLYVLTNQMIDDRYPNKYRPKFTDGSSPNTDRLYRNDFDSSKGHAVYTDVSKAAGITIEGFGLGLNITDINKDGWKDIYVTNDYLTNDLLWINNKNGTFTNRSADYFKHTSYSAMGNDVQDINNDGLVDVIAVDMLPETNERKKMMMSANNYQTNLNNDKFKYEYQYGRNTLQLNQGTTPENDSDRHPVFSDIGFFAGVAETDWSWTPLVTDFDNDGYRDIVITNGFPKDITDHDFMVFRASANKVASKEHILEQIPAVKLKNYAYHNNGNLTFANSTDDWGLDEPFFSSGAAYADFDNDGDMDMVISNINDPSVVYENVTAGHENANYLQVKFIGDTKNRNGIGAWAELYYNNGETQVYENNPYRGYISTIENIAHFGLGKTAFVDSLVIKWQNGRSQTLKNLGTNKRITVNIKDADQAFSWAAPATSPTLFTEVSDAMNPGYTHEEIDFADFNYQRLLPHKLSEYGPALAVGDLNGDGMDDLVSGGSYGYSAKLFFQQTNGSFVKEDLLPGTNKLTKGWEDLGVLVFDADGDGDMDVYTASGSYESQPNTAAYLDKLYINNGKGTFTIDSAALPKNLTSKSCVRAADYDKDGDLDLFVAGRVEPWSYPKPVSSFIYQNNSQNGKAYFTDVTKKVAPALVNLGLACDGVFTDFDNDGWSDLVVAGEWMPVTFLKNNKGIFENITAQTATASNVGFWTSIAPGDYDNDGDMDYIVGNMGLNSFYRASAKYPITMYAKDFDNNGSYDAIPTLFLSDNEGNKKEFAAQTRDDLVKQMIGFRSKFQNYKTFANAGMDKILTKEELSNALILKANTCATSLYSNNGDGTFTVSALAAPAQFSTINGMVADDFDGDGNLDVVMNGNDYGTEVTVGRYDALNGLLLKGDGKGGFTALPINQSGISIPGNGKALVKLRTPGNQYTLVGSQNRGGLKAFHWNNKATLIPLLPTDVGAIISFKNGKKQRQEFNYGSAFLSQSGRFIKVNNAIAAVEVFDSKGNRRVLKL